MPKEEIVILKLFGNETIIGTETSDNNQLGTHYRLLNPRLLTVAASMTGTVQLYITPICIPFKSTKLNKEITIPYNQVFFKISEDEIDKEIINNYKSEISGIKIATASDMSFINDTKDVKNGEFII